MLKQKLTKFRTKNFFLSNFLVVGKRPAIAVISLLLASLFYSSSSVATNDTNSDSDLPGSGKSDSRSVNHQNKKEAEYEKILALVEVYNREMNTNFLPSQLSIWSIGTILENGHQVTIYSCTPNLLQGISGPAGSVFHVSSASQLIAYDKQASVPARLYSSRLLDVRYVAFGVEETIKDHKGYRQVLRDAVVMPILTQEYVSLVAKAIHFNSIYKVQPIALDFQGIMKKGAEGQNLPWENYRVENLRPMNVAYDDIYSTSDDRGERVERIVTDGPNGKDIKGAKDGKGGKDIKGGKIDRAGNDGRVFQFVDFDQAKKQIASSGRTSPILVRIQKIPIALLDDYGRVVVGSFNFGNIDSVAASRVSNWHQRVQNHAQALWASKYLSTAHTLTPNQVLFGNSDSIESTELNSSVLKVTWDASTWPEKLPRPPSELPIYLIKSELSGQTSGEYRNPNHKYVLAFTDADEDLKFKLSIQNNIREIIGRPIPFGNRSDDGLFTSSNGAFSDLVNVQMGFDSVEMMDNAHHVAYDFNREVPHGVIIIQEMETNQAGQLARLRATIQFEVQKWADVHPAGNAIVKIDFTLPDFVGSKNAKKENMKDKISCETALGL